MSISAPGWPTAAGQITEQIKQARIKINDVTGAVIPQEMIEAIDRIRKIGIALAIDNIDALIRVQMKEQQAMFMPRASSWRWQAEPEESEKQQAKSESEKKRRGNIMEILA